MVMARRGGPLLVVVFVASLLVGCGQRELARKTPYPTTGTVTYKGEPVRYAAIHLNPQDERGILAEGFIKEDGTFAIRTFGNEEPDGAVPGTYEVELDGYKVTEHGGLPKGATPTKLPSTPFKTGVIVEIQAEDNHLDITIP